MPWNYEFQHDAGLIICIMTMMLNITIINTVIILVISHFLSAVR